LRQLARLGAAARVQELRREEAAIRALFPDAFGRGQPGRKSGANDAGNGLAPRRGRPKMTAADKRAVSIRMRKYWAQRRKTKAKAVKAAKADR
jgi:hypothetical protein